MEPGTGLAILGSAIGSAKLLEKILGPTAEYLGEGVKEITKKRVENLSRIFNNAKRKLGSKLDEPGRVPPRVLKGILEEGSFCEDEIGAEYFGGALASSRSGIVRDDRGATILALLSRMSSYEIRSHYLFYQVIKNTFNNQDLNINLLPARSEMEIFIPMEEYARGLQVTAKENFGQILIHVLNGLSREMLIGFFYKSGSVKNLQLSWKEAKKRGIIIEPTAFGTELFFWAYGLRDEHTENFLDSHLKFPPISDIYIPQNPIKTKVEKL